MILYDKIFFASLPSKVQLECVTRTTNDQLSFMKTTLKNLFIDIPGRVPEELINTLMENEHCRIERIISQGHCTPFDQWYDQDWDEWVLLLQGQAILKFSEDLANFKMEPGDFIFIPAHLKHRVEWTPPDADTLWLAIHLHPGSKMTFSPPI